MTIFSAIFPLAPLSFSFLKKMKASSIVNSEISGREKSSINTFLAASFSLVPLQEEQGFNVMNFAISSLISEESDS